MIGVYESERVGLIERLPLTPRAEQQARRPSPSRGEGRGEKRLAALAWGMASFYNVAIEMERDVATLPLAGRVNVPWPSSRALGMPV